MTERTGTNKVLVVLGLFVVFLTIAMFLYWDGKAFIKMVKGTEQAWIDKIKQVP